MRIRIEKKLIPQLNTKIAGFKAMEQYKFDGYSQDNQFVMTVPSDDIPVDLVKDIVRIGATVEAFEYWVEIPNANLGDTVPAELSYATYFDNQEPPVEQNTLWSDLDEFASNFAATATMRYRQASNNGVFNANDVEVIEEAGFEVFGKAALNKKINAEYEDTGDPEYTEIETIEYIDQNWRFGGYQDMIHAYKQIDVLFQAKGATENDRWAACTDAEKEVIVRWNLVGLNKSTDILPPGWGEGRQLKELGKLYREFNFNMVLAAEKRFTVWYQYINMILSNAGRTKFHGATYGTGDWNWDLKEAYTHEYARQYDNPVSSNALVQFQANVIDTYVDADYLGTIPAATINVNLTKVLNGKTFTI